MSSSVAEIPRQKIARQLTITLTLVLAAVLLIETLYLSKLPLIPLMFVISIKSAPLLLFIPALRNPKPLTPVWYSMLLLLYVCWAVLGLWAPGMESFFALIRLLLVSACFIAAMSWGWKVKKPAESL